jgi:hypothetical protein
MRRANLPIFIVLYNPNAKILDRLISISKRFEVFIFDNSLKPHNGLFLESHYYWSSINKGISGALIWMNSICKNYGFKRFIFFDQDTIFTTQTILHIENDINNILSENVVVHYTSEIKKKEFVKYVINSGTVYPQKLLDISESVIKRYFVDAIDLILCVLAQKNSYELLVRDAPEIDHLSAQGYAEKKIFNHIFLYKLYPSSREAEFFLSHLRLIIDCFKAGRITSVLYVTKVTFAFTISQIRARLLRSI